MRPRRRARRAGGREASVTLVFITQRVDEQDPALGATVAKLRALAAQVDELVVLALAAVPTELPANVRVRTFGGSRRGVRGIRLVAALAPELRRRPVAVVAHMAPVYAVIAAPLTRPLRVPLLLWFTHWRVSRTLRLAERLVTRVVTVDRQSFPLPSAKVVPVGHGIEVPERPIAPREEDGVLRLLALGRTSPAKGLEPILAAVRSLDSVLVDLEIRGPSLTDEECRHRERPPGAWRTCRGTGTAHRHRDRVRAGRCARQQHARRRARQGRLRGSRRRPAGARREHGLRWAHRRDRATAPLPAGRRGVDRRPDSRPRAGRSGARRAIGMELRDRVARDHSVEHWAQAVLEAAR